MKNLLPSDIIKLIAAGEMLAEAMHNEDGKNKAQQAWDEAKATIKEKLNDDGYE